MATYSGMGGLSRSSTSPAGATPAQFGYLNGALTLPTLGASTHGAGWGLVNTARQRMSDWNNTSRPVIMGAMNDQISRAKAMGDFSLDSARAFDQHFWNNIAPFETEMLANARRFGSAQYRSEQGERAAAGAQMELQNAQNQRIRDQQRRGINPFSGRALGDERAMEVDRALAIATARAKAQLAADQLGLDVGLKTLEGFRGASDRGLNAINTGANAIGRISDATNVAFGLDNANFQNVAGAYQAGVQGLNAEQDNIFNYNLGLQRNQNDYALRNYQLEIDKWNLGEQQRIARERNLNDYNASIFASQTSGANSRRAAGVERRDQNLELIGTGAGIGFSVGGPVGGLVGGALGAIGSLLFD